MIDDIKNQTLLDEKLAEAKKYVGEPRINLYLNTQKWMPLHYGDESIKNESKIISQQFSSIRPQFASMAMEVDFLEDNTDYIQLG